MLSGGCWFRSRPLVPTIRSTWPGFKMKSEAVQQQQVVNVRWHPFHDRQGPMFYWFTTAILQHALLLLLAQKATDVSAHKLI